MNVVSVVRWALEFLESDGVGAVRLGGVAGGGDAAAGLCGRIEAQRLLEVVLMLPDAPRRALMARVHAEDIRLGVPAWKDLAAVLWHAGGESVQLYEREMTDWMVRKWMRPHDGSWREAGRLFDCDDKTARGRFDYVFAPVLDGWMVVARGVLEVAINDIFEELPIAA